MSEVHGSSSNPDPSIAAAAPHTGSVAAHRLVRRP